MVHIIEGGPRPETLLGTEVEVGWGVTRKV